MTLFLIGKSRRVEWHVVFLHGLEGKAGEHFGICGLSQLQPDSAPFKEFTLMSKTIPTWPKKHCVNGVSSTSLTSWEEFHSIVNVMIDLPHYVFRGQRESNWLLEPSLARMLKNHPDRSTLIAEHLERFKHASRGRRGQNPPLILNDDYWWALGQHHGLATPLLDWTNSPYVALFFALEEKSDSDHAIVFALNTRRIMEALNLDELFGDPSDADLTFVRPLSDENSRLVAQAGLFTRSPIEIDIERWVSKRFAGESKKVTLLKIFIPKNERIKCLKALNVMNINHTTLFPDLYGAGKHTTEFLRRSLHQ